MSLQEKNNLSNATPPLPPGEAVPQSTPLLSTGDGQNSTTPAQDNRGEASPHTTPPLSTGEGQSSTTPLQSNWGEVGQTTDTPAQDNRGEAGQHNQSESLPLSASPSPPGEGQSTATPAQGNWGEVVQNNWGEVALIIKIGGNIIDNDTALQSFLQSFAAVPGYKILVHGGGKLATQLAAQLNIPQQMVNGRRITDAETLKIVTMVYAGDINKRMVAGLQKNNCNAMGLTGADGNMAKATKRTSSETDYGFVGDIIENGVNASLLTQLLQAGLTPVIAPITHNGAGQLLNTNADTMANEIAVALSAFYKTTLIYCFEKKGILHNPEDDDSVIASVNPVSFETLKAENIITAGMIPKIENALKAVQKGVSNVIIGHAAELEKMMLHQSGTTISNE
jgi:acetylglutamate kinase